ncbi:MAG: hypothetical protein AB7F32_04115 [Victivallaceae bacterium]
MPIATTLVASEPKKDEFFLLLNSIVLLMCRKQSAFSVIKLTVAANAGANLLQNLPAMFFALKRGKGRVLPEDV